MPISVLVFFKKKILNGLIKISWRKFIHPIEIFLGSSKTSNHSLKTVICLANGPQLHV